MPYNTRRKSLSLPSLGIHIPCGRRPSVAPPSKKLKRAHDKADQTEEADKTVDVDGADDIVAAVIRQLERTANRPHLIKELAAVLAATTDAIANSANAAALISSRLSLYLKRPWTALAPCPIAKELIPVHPRKVFFYLTTRPRQPLPVSSPESPISPALSPGSPPLLPDDDLELDLEDYDEHPYRLDRARLSPSPEVDLDLDLALADPSSAFSSSSSCSLRAHAAHGHRISHNHRAASPPLEGDEREFTLTATIVRERTSDLPSSASAQPDPLGMPDIDSPYPEEHPGVVSDYFSRPISIPAAPPPSDDERSGIYGTSPAPSVASLSSVTTAASECGDSDEEHHVQHRAGQQRAAKRSYEASFGKTLPLAVDCGYGFVDALEWVDFRSPETVDVDELDAIFADI